MRYPHSVSLIAQKSELLLLRQSAPKAARGDAKTPSLSNRSRMSRLGLSLPCIKPLLGVALAVIVLSSWAAAPVCSATRQTYANLGASVPYLATPSSISATGNVDRDLRLSPASVPDQAVRARVSEAYGNLPLSFEANQGQADARVKFISRGSGYSLFLTATEAALALAEPRSEDNSVASAEAPSLESNTRPSARPAGETQQVLRMRLIGANAGAEISGAQQLPGHVNYFIGDAPERWRTNVPTYAQVRYRGIYPGIDLVYYGNQRQLEYDFIVAPGANPRRIRLSFAGARSMSIDAAGDLVLQTGGGEVRQRRPVIYQEINGRRQAVAGRFVLRGRREVGFRVGHYDRSRPLVIDPILSYSTYLGDNNFYEAYDVAVDSSGHAYVTGQRSSFTPPSIANSILIGPGGATDAFIVKFNPQGSALLYATYFGGSSNERATSIAVDAEGNAFITGVTASSNFPTVGALQSASGGGRDVFIAKLNASGSAFVYSTYLGGANYDHGSSIAIDASGSAYVTGQTESRNFPTASALQTVKRGHAAFRSADGGTSWSGSDAGLNGATVQTLIVDPTNPALLYAGTESGVYKSTNGGASWTAASSGLSNIPVNVLVMDPTNPATLYAGAGNFEVAGGVFKSTDGGGSWTASSAGLPSSSIVALAIDPTNPNIIYAGGSGVHKSTDGGLSWSSTPLTGGSIADIVIDPTNPATIYVGTSNGIFKSVNGGGSWTASNTGLTSAFTTMLAIDPVNPNILYADTNNFYRSTNGGASWSVVPGFANVGVSALAFARTNPLIIYAGTQVGLVYRSIDGGQTWVLTSVSAPSSYVYALAIDPVNPSALYIGVYGGADIFIAKLNPAGSALTYATYLGGNGDQDWGQGIAADAYGNVYVTGRTNSADFPTANPLQPQIRSFTDAFVLKLNAAGSALVYSTYLGGNNSDSGNSIAVDAAGNAHVTGFTFSTDFPTMNPLQATRGGGLSDIFVAKLDPAGSALVYSTYIGGNGTEEGYGIALDAPGNIYVTGYTRSTNFPTANSLQASNAGGFADAFVLKLSGDGSALVYSTYLGGSDDDRAYSIAVDAQGNAYIAGATRSRNFPVVNAYQPALGGSSATNAFIARIGEPSISGLVTTNSAAGLGGVTLTLSGSATATTVTDAGGRYLFSNLAVGGNYTVTPSLPGYSFNPASLTLTNLNSAQVANFNAIPAAGSIQFSSASYSVSENGGSATIAVSRTNAPAGSVTVNYATADGTATAGSDYTSASGTLAFAEGETSKTFSVPILRDLLAEPDETITLTLSSPTGGAVLATPSVAVLTITDDTPRVQFSASGYAAGEADGHVTINVTRAGDPAPAVSVDYATQDATATQRADYTLATGTLRFAAGQTSASFIVPLTDDAHMEGTESFTVVLSNPGAAALGAPATATINITDNDAAGAVNPIDTNARYFVAQHYLDFLNRAPDQAGLDFWTEAINSCDQTGDAQARSFCIENARNNVSAAFFLSIEFQETGFLVYRFYLASLPETGARPRAFPRYLEFMRDTQAIRQGVQVGVGDWQAQLAANQQAFAEEWVGRAEFLALYPETFSPEQFVDALYSQAGVVPAAAERQAAIDEFANPAGGLRGARARALRRVAENRTLIAREFNRAFVLLQYFGYLRRNPDESPDTDFGGYDFWLGKLTEHNGNFISSQMVLSFLNSLEYRGRFGQP